MSKEEMKSCPNFDSWFEGNCSCLYEQDGVCKTINKPCPYMEVVEPPFSLRQTELKEWQERNFPASLYDDMNRDQLVERIRILELSVGMAEEVGELSHIILKASQKIRDGISGKIDRNLVADGFADTVIYGTQLLSKLGIDAEEAIRKTISNVLKRDWANNRKNAESKIRRLFIKGDGVGMIYAQPGNDTTSLLALEDEEEGKKVHCWDIWFGLDLYIDREKLWLLSDNELDSTTYHHLYGSVTCRDQIERTKKEKL